MRAKSAENFGRYYHYSTSGWVLSIGKMKKCDERFVAFFGVWCFFLLQAKPIASNNGSSRGDGPLTINKD
jgi:hypothetical protein